MNRCCCCCCCCWAPSIVSIRVCTVAAVQFFSSHQPFPIIPKNSQTRNVCTAHAHTQCRNEQKNIRAAHAAWSKIYYWVFVELGRRAENMWKHTHQIVCSPQALCHHSTSEHRDRHIERTGELRKKKNNVCWCLRELFQLSRFGYSLTYRFFFHRTHEHTHAYPASRLRSSLWNLFAFVPHILLSTFIFFFCSHFDSLFTISDGALISPSLQSTFNVVRTFRLSLTIFLFRTKEILDIYQLRFNEKSREESIVWMLVWMARWPGLCSYITAEMWVDKSGHVSMLAFVTYSLRATDLGTRSIIHMYSSILSMTNRHNKSMNANKKHNIDLYWANIDAAECSYCSTWCSMCFFLHAVGPGLIAKWNDLQFVNWALQSSYS